MRKVTGISELSQNVGLLTPSGRWWSPQAGSGFPVLAVECGGEPK